MVKFTELVGLLKYPWEQVATGLWERYPNPYSSHVLTEDVISRQIDGNKLISKRMLTKTNKVPKWGERFMGGVNYIVLVEESVVDPDEKTLTTYTRSITMKNVMNVEEKCVYKISPENSSWTLCEKSACISSPVRLFGKPIEAFGIKRFKSNAVKATKGFEYVLNSLYHPDVTKDHHQSTADFIKDKARKAADNAKLKTAVYTNSLS